MAATVGLTGSVTSFTGTFNAATLALMSANQFTLSTEGFALDTTEYAAPSIVRARIKGLKSWRVQFGGYLATPVNGVAGNISGAAYSTNIRAWEMTLRADALDTTTMPVTDSWRTFSPGLATFEGSYEALVDGTTAIAEAAHSSEPLTGTFTVASGQTLAGTIFTTGAEVVSQVGGVQVVRYSYLGTGHLTSVGSANVIPAATTIATPVAGTITLTAATSRTYAGSALWTEIGIRVPHEGLVETRMAVQGSGALTIA